MTKYFKFFLIKLLTPVVSKLGFVRNVNLYSTDQLLGNLFSTLNKLNFEPQHIVDVGAHHGSWTRNALSHFPDAHYTLLEPQTFMKASIQDLLQVNPKIKFYALGAGEKAGSFKFTIADREDSCSFSYTEEQAKALGFQQIEVPVVTLNDFVPTTGLPIPDVIKIDAEGIDIQVLLGSNDFFGKTEMFFVEAGVMCKEFDNSFLKMATFMDKNGYRLFDITDMNRPFEKSVLWLVELVFIKKGGFIDSQSFVSVIAD
jgi:FkbM family methyltransferase